LNLINKELLIIETRDNPRFTSLQLKCDLLKMAKKMEINESYGVTPTPKGVWHSPGTDASGGINSTGEAAISPINSPKFAPRATM